MVSLRHSVTAAGANNAAKQVSRDAWNAEHHLTGTPGKLISFDADGNPTEIDPPTGGSSQIDDAVAGTDPSASSVTRSASKIAALFLAASKFDGPVNVKWFGAKGDGATDDTTAFQAALNTISSSSSLTRSLYVPGGTYLVTGLTITAATGLTIRGEGRTKTIIYATSTNPALQINGLWYSTIAGISFGTKNALTNKGAVEQDGNYDGTHTQGTQGITWEQCDFSGYGANDGLISTYAFAMNRQGTNGAQGSECVFLNCHFYNGSEACYFQAGFNALNNTFIGGNFQNYKKHGIELVAGSVQLFSVGFQSTHIEEQLNAGGYDFYSALGSAGDVICIYGCRTESINFCNTGSAQVVDIRGLNQQQTWNNHWVGATTAVTLNSYITRTSTSGLFSLYKATTAGTSGASEPTWPDSGTVTDGSVVWTRQTVNAIVGTNVKAYDPSINTLIYSNSVDAVRTHNRAYKFIAGPKTYTPLDNDELIEVDCTAGDVTINNPPVSRQVWGGRELTVIRTDTTPANKANFNGTYMLPGGSITINFANSGGASQWQAVIGAYQPGKNAITVAQLPGVSQCPINTRFTVTDSNTSTFNATVAGGGSTRMTVINDGVNWKVG